MGRSLEWVRVGELRTSKRKAATFDQARTAAMVADARLKELAVAAREGALVERAAGERIAFAFARRHRDAWLVWPARIGAELAVALGCDAGAVIGLLERYVARQLDELGSERFDLGASLVDGAAGGTQDGAAVDGVGVGGRASRAVRTRRRRAGALADESDAVSPRPV
jgi:hypothetical protein